MPPDATYQFKHALVQDAAYASLVRSRRQQLHGQIAHALEQRFPEIVATEPEILAHHFAEAGTVERAIEYWLKAGQRAVSRSANIEAARYLTKGIELSNLLPPSVERVQKETELYLALGPALRAVKGYGAPETLQAFSRARDLVGEGGTQAQQMIVSGGLFNLHLVRAEHSAAREVAKETLALAMRQGHEELTVLGMRQVGTTSYYMGEFAEARRYLERTLKLRPTRQEIVPFLEDDHVYALSFLSWTLWCLGYPEQAAVTCEQSLSRAREVKHLFTTAMALCTGPFLGVFGADPRNAADQASDAVAHAAEHGLTNWENWGRMSHAALLSRLGKHEQAIEIMHDALTKLDRAGAKFVRPMQLGQLAAVHSRLGANEVAVGLVDEAIQRSQETGEHYYDAELYRLRGEFLLNLGSPVDAESHWRKALSVAKHQHAKWWELRAATTLAQHWRSQGRHVDARDVLLPVYSWFTEGFGTSDLKAAKALLEDLSAAATATTQQLNRS